MGDWELKSVLAFQQGVHRQQPDTVAAQSTKSVDEQVIGDVSSDQE